MEMEMTAQNMDDVPLSNVKKTDNEQPACDLARLSELSKKALSAYTISELADKCNLSRSFLSHLLNGKLTAQPSKKSISKLARVGFRHDITLPDLLTAAGYIDEAQTIKQKYHISIGDAIAEYYSDSPVLGLSLFLKTLAEKQTYGIHYQIDYHPGYFNIKTEREYDLFSLPAFCNKESGVDAMMLSVLQRVVSLLMLPHTNDSLYFIITDNSEIYQRLLKGFEPIPNIKASLLYTKDYLGFDKQDVLKIDRSDFPVILSP